MENKSPDVRQVMVLACLIGLGLIYAAYDGRFSATTLYLGIGVSVVGSFYLLFTKPGMVVLIAGVAGKILMGIDLPLTISAVLLAFWYVFDYVVLGGSRK